MSSSDPTPLSSPVDVSDFDYVVGIDVGSQVCIYTICQPDKRLVVKPTELINGRGGSSSWTRSSINLVSLQHGY